MTNLLHRSKHRRWSAKGRTVVVEYARIHESKRIEGIPDHRHTLTLGLAVLSTKDCSTMGVLLS